MLRRISLVCTWCSFWSLPAKISSQVRLCGEITYCSVRVSRTWLELLLFPSSFTQSSVQFLRKIYIKIKITEICFWDMLQLQRFTPLLDYLEHLPVEEWLRVSSRTNIQPYSSVILMVNSLPGSSQLLKLCNCASSSKTCQCSQYSHSSQDNNS